MRKTEMVQLKTGDSFIKGIVIDPESRDDIPALLPGLHTDAELRAASLP